MDELEAGREIGWVDVADIPDDAVSVCPFLMGSIAPHNEATIREMASYGMTAETSVNLEGDRMGNAFLVENLFNYPGLSRYGLSAMLNKDINAISGVVMVLGITFIILNILSDLIVAWLDPRVRLMGGSEA